MFHLSIITSFAAAHNLLHYQGDCENLHGHNWKVEVTVSAEGLDKSGLGIDFKILKKHTREVMNYLDHKYLNDLDAFTDISPSSEQIARFIFEQIEKSLQEYEVIVQKVTVWESDNAYAAYTRS
ncbi:6-carboxytetrahydropterin synthase QueD [Pelovirga terrestris]|uniref:6-carboxy-5,6,7,8-tetrahydropterin synthase n=1 Tax=Pelovirga terrestris TaxID=2771352 RepID=A0A8J6QW12_9BACT|nr:6-carboxytetrahydropterin synthase QueD [Pelovirga terrestris]MBD1399243.1 6-carboxytetrahydropterin synthase QueD [Pelovirga terrestris]